MIAAASAVKYTHNYREITPAEIYKVEVQFEGSSEWQTMPERLVSAWNEFPHDKFCATNVLKKGQTNMATGLAVTLHEGFFGSVSMFYEPAFQNNETDEMTIKLYIDDELARSRRGAQPKFSVKLPAQETCDWIDKPVFLGPKLWANRVIVQPAEAGKFINLQTICGFEGRATMW